ncbi:MAG: hypothetical protein PHH24_01540 [Candidatus Moranbacteria bacterium]|nr:hypothetical protein [Candidatus Moranbacteria bacterium]MDD5652292.1 hypothetical protein [Candidatus Moranbacteria bacterium]
MLGEGEKDSRFCKECGKPRENSEKNDSPKCSVGDHDRYKSYGDKHCRDCGKKL